ADGLERIEGNADRKDDSENRERRLRARPAQRLLERFQEEVAVLEPDQQAQVRHDADAQEQAATWRRVARLDRARKRVVERRRCADEESEPDIPPRIKDEARDQEQVHAGSRPRQEPVRAQYRTEEKEILLCRERHGT